MPIRVQCAGCKTTLAVKDHLAGKKVRCPKCQAPIAVPEPGMKPPAPMSVKPAAGKVPVAKPARPLKAKTPAAPAIDVEAEALAALRDEPANSPSPNGSNGTPANGAAPPTNAAANGANGAAAPIKFQCEFCEAQIEFPADMAGKRGQCPECKQLVKVPVPKVEKPKDWRTVETKGPTLARANQPEKIADAWGTETKAKVSQSALLEAGVIKKPKKPPIGLEGWIERGVKWGLLTIVVGGVGWGIFSLRAGNVAKELPGKLEPLIPDKAPPVVQGEMHLLIADTVLQQPKAAEATKEQFDKAWMRSPLPPTEPRDKIDRDYFLIHVAKAQVKLGGNEFEVANKERFDWRQEVIEVINRTVAKIESPEAKTQAIREVAALMAEKKKPELNLSLAAGFKSLHIALLWADPAKQKEALKILPYPDMGRTIDVVARCGYAEGFARQDKVDDALKLAQAPGQTVHKVHALLAVAEYLALDASADRSAKIKEACEAVAKLLEKDHKAPVPPWLLVEHVRLSARVDMDLAKGLVEKLPAACKRRGQLEVVLAQLDKNPPPAEAPAMIRELDKEGPGRGLAWLTLAMSKARANQSFHFTPEDPDEELLQPFFRAVHPTP